MDLSLPLRSLIPSLDADVLAVLAGTESALGVTQIARLSARGSRQGVAVVLDRLTEHGLVHAYPTNRGHVFALNRGHVLAPVLLTALDVRNHVVKLLTEHVAALEPSPVHISIFGSFARGEGNAESDIDLLIVTPDAHDNHDEHWTDQLRAVDDVMLRATGNRLEPLVLTLDTLRQATKAGEPLIGELTSEAIRLYGQPLDELINTDRPIR